MDKIYRLRWFNDSADYTAEEFLQSLIEGIKEGSFDDVTDVREWLEEIEVIND